MTRGSFSYSFKEYIFSISSKSKVLSVSKVPGMAHASAADRESSSAENQSKIALNFDKFSVSILDRFGVVLERQLGVIFGLFGAQVRPSSVQNASGKLVNIKNVICHQTHARVYGSANFRAKMASKMPQDRPKTTPRGS